MQRGSNHCQQLKEQMGKSETCIPSIIFAIVLDLSSRVFGKYIAENESQVKKVKSCTRTPMKHGASEDRQIKLISSL